MKLTNKIGWLLLLLTVSTLHAQSFLIAPAHLQSDYQLPVQVDTQIKTKMQKALSQQGTNSSPEKAVFALVPQISILSEQTTATVPPISKVEYEIVFRVVNIFDGTVFGTYSFSVNGQGSNKINAIAKGLKKVSLSKEDFSAFLHRTKNEILDHYEKEALKIIKKATSAMNMKNYDEALSMLSQVPEDIPSYDKVLQLMEKNYQLYTEEQAQVLLRKAKSLWASSKDANTAREVAELLSEIPSNTSAIKGADALIKEIDTHTVGEENYKKKMEEKRLNHKHMETQASIEAAKAIGMAYAKNMRSTVVIWK